MIIQTLTVLSSAALLAWAGCSRHGVPEAGAASPSLAPAGQPQAKLPTIKLWLGAKEIVAEQAISPEQVQTGMMFRKSMGENEGMLFVFPRPHRASFWMRNTLIPLTCAYIDPAGGILEIRDMKPLDETSLTASSDQVQYVLEMNRGWFERNGITAGTVIRTERGSLEETYFRRR